jgi:glutathione-independent formaldehyde dehydrogenase
VVRATGKIGVVGIYEPCDEDAATDLIVRGHATPSQIISHELPLDDAVTAYDQFGKRATAGPRSSCTLA